MPTMGQAAVVAPASLSVQDLAQLLAASRKDHFPEWNMSQHNGNPLQWHQWFDRFKSAIDASSLTDEVKLTYSKTLVTGKVKTAIAEFACCDTMYQDALRTLEWKFGQTHVVVSAHLDTLSQFPSLRRHNSGNTISYSATISASIGVFLSLHYVQDLTSVTLLGQAYS